MTLTQCVKKNTLNALKPITNNLIEYNNWSQKNYKRASYQTWHFVLMLYPMINTYSTIIDLILNKNEYSTIEACNELHFNNGILFFGWIIADIMSINRDRNHLDQPTENYHQWQNRVFPLVSGLLVCGVILSAISLSIQKLDPDNSNEDNYISNDIITDILIFAGNSTLSSILCYFLLFRCDQPKFSEGNNLENLRQNLMRNAIEIIVEARANRANNPPITITSIEELEDQERLERSNEKDLENKFELDASPDLEQGPEEQIISVIEEESEETKQDKTELEHTKQMSNLGSKSSKPYISNKSENNCSICLAPLKEKTDSNNNIDYIEYKEDPEQTNQIDMPEINIELEVEESKSNEEEAQPVNSAINKSNVHINIDQEMKVGANRVENSRWKPIAKLPCDHLYHLTCLEMWYTSNLENGHNCPECRDPFSIPDNISNN